MNQFKVRCNKAKTGYQWMGNLGCFDQHLNQNSERKYEFEGCKFVKVSYTHGCSETFQCCVLETHQTSKCALRPFICEYCEEFKSWYKDKDNSVPCPIRNSCEEFQM